MSNKLSELIDFVRFTHEIRNVRRAIVFEDDHHENDMEHQYQFALTAWFLIENDNLPLDKFKCVGMAMVHDIVEVYAGDLMFFASEDNQAAQAKREKEAVHKLRQQWPTFTSLHELINEYEKHETPEAKFVYALDKVLPMINNYLYGGKAWVKAGVTFDEMKKKKEDKVNLSPEIYEYYSELLKILEQKPELFGVKK